MLTPGRALYHLRRELSRGAASAWHEHAVARRILKWRAPAEVVARPPEPIPTQWRWRDIRIVRDGEGLRGDFLQAGRMISPQKAIRALRSIAGGAGR